MNKQKEHVIDIVFSLSLLCVFTVCGLLVVFIGINVYKSTVNNMEDAFSDRTAMSFVAKQIRQNDRADGVYVSDIEGETALVLAEEMNGEVYCKYIYYYDGYLRELYAKEGYEPVLMAGQTLIAIDGFDITVQENATLTIYIEDYENGGEELTLALMSTPTYE
ncbi:MAG: DUF4860 domain-containing protein [Lachnospiraceae bacterium]